MFLRVCQMSSAIHKLKLYGHLAYLKWSILLPCSRYLNDLNGLDEMTNEFETILMDWINYIWNCRYHFSELNYYTTNQLILLQQELTLLMQNKSDQISPQVFHLLHSTVGRPVDSTMLLKKVLTKDLDENKEANVCLEEQVMLGSSHEQHFTDIEKIEKETSKIASAIKGLEGAQKKLFDELKDYGYDDFIILQAILHQNITDIHSAMGWIDDCPNDECVKFESFWTEKQNSCNVWSSRNRILTSPTEDANTANNLQQGDRLDITPIVNAFFHTNKQKNLERYFIIIILVIIIIDYTDH